MAALLRSARFLKCSPSGLLQSTRTNTNGLPLSRLFIGAIRGKISGVCPREIVPRSVHANRYFCPYAPVRQFGVIPEHQWTAKDEPVSDVRSRQSQQFEWALAKLDTSVRRTGRVTKNLLLQLFNDVCAAGCPNGNQALLLLRTCGSLLPELPVEERTQLVHQFWDKLKELGASYDVSHYNALLKVHLQNSFNFSPTDFLAKMEAEKVQPNRVTYQRLITAYCQRGDIEGASQILGFMKTNNLPITESVFNSLVTGHARAGDMESAENILGVMRGAGVEPGPDTYLALLKAYAEKGDMAKIKQTLETIESTDASLMDRDFMQVIYSLAKGGYQQHVPEITEHIKLDRGFVPDAMNLCLSLITQGHEDTAFLLLKAFPNLQRDSSDRGNFFLRHCVNMEKPSDRIIHFCKELQELKMHSTPIQFSVFCALEAKKTGMAMELMKMMKEEGLPVRPHFFWPLLAHYQKEKNIAGTVEVLKGMQELGVPPDSDTFSTYILPNFPNMESARTALQEAGGDLLTEGYLLSELRSEAGVGNLSGVFSMLSSPTFPAIPLIVFKRNLITGFRRSDDVESMAEITDLLFTDSRFSTKNAKPNETTSDFLCDLIEDMPTAELQGQKEKLRKFFNQLKTKNVSIPLKIYKRIRNLLDSHNTSDLIKDVILLVDRTNFVTTDDSKGLEERLEALEKTLVELKAENRSVDLTLKKLIFGLCSEKNLERALQLKIKYEEDMTAEGYAALIHLCCDHDNVEEALTLKAEMSGRDLSAELDTSRYVALIKVLVKNGRLEEALDMLREMKEKNVVLDGEFSGFVHVLKTAALTGDNASVQRLQDTIFTLGLAKPSGRLCSPLISMHLDSGDLSGALEAIVECHRQYRLVPKIHDLICSLVEKGETELLQKATDFVSQERGEMSMLYTLLFAFIEKGRYREARKILETPGIRARPSLLQWYAEKCIAGGQMDSLEKLVELTEKLFECDRDEMYHYILRLCKSTNNWQKAESTWTKMQEENLIPRDRTLLLLADILQRNGKEVPFEVPEIWYKQDDAGKRSEAQGPASIERNPTNFDRQIMMLCKDDSLKEAIDLLKYIRQKGGVLKPFTYNFVLQKLLSKGRLEEAFAVRDIAVEQIPNFCLFDMANSYLIITQVKKGQVKDALATLRSMLEARQQPSQVAVGQVFQALAKEGDIQTLQDVDGLLKSSGVLRFQTMLVNSIALAHINKGELESAVEALEDHYTQSAEPAESSDSESSEDARPVGSMALVFRKVLEEKNEAALDRLSAMAERLANQFSSYRAVSDLFVELLDSGRGEDAKFLLQRCPNVAEQKEIFSAYMNKVTKRPGQLKKIELLLELVPDFIDRKQLRMHMLNVHALENDLASAKTVYEQMQQEGMEVDEPSLKKLAHLYKAAGEPVPFQEPPETSNSPRMKRMKKRWPSDNI